MAIVEAVDDASDGLTTVVTSDNDTEWEHNEFSVVWLCTEVEIRFNKKWSHLIN